MTIHRTYDFSGANETLVSEVTEGYEAATGGATRYETPGYDGTGTLGRIDVRKLFSTRITFGADEWSIGYQRHLVNPPVDMLLDIFRAGTFLTGPDQGSVWLRTDGRIVLRCGSTDGAVDLDVSDVSHVGSSGFWITHHLDRDGAFQEVYIYAGTTRAIVQTLTATAGVTTITEHQFGSYDATATHIARIDQHTLGDEQLTPPLPPPVGIIATYDLVGTVDATVTAASEGAADMRGSGSMVYTAGWLPFEGDPAVLVTGTRFLVTTPPSGPFGPHVWTRVPYQIETADAAARAFVLVDAAGFIVGGVSMAPDGKVRLRFGTGFVAASADTYLNGNGPLFRHHVDQTTATQTLTIASRKGVYLEELSGECGTTPIVEHHLGLADAAAGTQVRMGAATIADVPLALAAGTDIVYALSGTKDHLSAAVTARIVGGYQARLITPEGVSGGDALLLADTGGGYCRWNLTRDPAVAPSREVDWAIEYQGDPGEAWDTLQEGHFTYPRPAGQTGTELVAIAGCQAHNNRGGKDRAWPHMGDRNPDVLVFTGDWGYANRGDSGTVEDHLADEEVVFTEFRSAFDVLAVTDNKRSNSDHDGGGGSNTYFNGTTITRHNLAYRKIWPHWVPAEAPADCKFESWVHGRTCHIKVDTRSNQRSDPYAADSDAKTCLGLWQRAQVLDLLNSPPAGTVGFVFYTDMGWIADGAAMKNTGKADAWASYPHERAMIGAAMAGKRGTIEQGDWHHAVMLAPGDNPWGGWQVMGAASTVRSSGNLNIFSEFLLPGIQGWPPKDPATGKWISQSLEIYALLEIVDDGTTYSHEMTAWDAAANVIRLQRTETWGGVPAPLIDRRVVIDGLDLTDHAFKIGNSGAAWTVAAKRGENQVIPTLPGREWQADKVHDEAELSLEMFVLGANANGTIPADRRGLVLERLHNLSRRFRPAGLVEMLVYEGADVYQAWVEQIAGHDMSATGTGLARFVAQLKIPEGVWRDRDVISQTLPLSAATENLAFTDFAGATAPMWDAVITIEKKCFGPRLSDQHGSTWMKYEGENGAFETLVVGDPDPHSVTKDGVDVSDKVRQPGGGPLMILTPRRLDGAYVLRVVADEIGPNTNVTLTGQRRFWVA